MLSRSVRTPSRAGQPVPVPKAAATRIYGGAIVCSDAQGLALPGAADAGLAFLGVAESEAISSERTVRVRRHVDFLLRSDPADPVTAANIGRPCWIVDDEFVAASDGGGARPPAGIVTGLEPNGRVWVRGEAAAAASAGSGAGMQAAASDVAELSATLDAAAIRALRMARRVLVPAPGAGRAIVVEEIRVSKRGNTPKGAGTGWINVYLAPAAGGFVTDESASSEASRIQTGSLTATRSGTGLFDDGDRTLVRPAGGNFSGAYILRENAPLVIAANASGGRQDRRDGLDGDHGPGGGDRAALGRALPDHRRAGLARLDSFGNSF